MLERAHAQDLAAHLSGAGYTLEATTDRLGEVATAALARNTTLAARRVLADADDPLATLARLFLFHDTVPVARAASALGDVDRLVDVEVLRRAGDGVRAAIEIRPYAADGPSGFDGWVAHDLIPILDGRLGRSRPDFVLGLSPASTTLAQMALREPVRRALDLGTGCGVQSLHLSGHARHVVATDLNPRAVRMARLTAGLNGLDLDVREGSLYEPVAGELFDLIVTNPPYVMSPPTGERLVYREGMFTGDDLVRRVVTEGAAHLAPGGSLQVLGNWAVLDGQPWEDRLRSWIAPTGCDALVMERERLDPYEYIEVWLNDAGLVGTEEYRPRFAEWVDYFDHLGITGVGMGWIMLTNAGREHPDVQIEQWPHQVHQPVADAFATHRDGVDAAEASDDDLLATPWRLHPRVEVETVGRPGEADPQHIVYRQRYGFGRAIEVDTALGAVLGASDGDLTADQIISAVASLLDVDAGSLSDEVIPKLRELVREGWLTR